MSASGRALTSGAPGRHAPRDLPPLPGVTLTDAGAEVSVYAGHADAVELCLFEPGDDEGASERRVELTDRVHGWWFGTVEELGVGSRYGFRAHGPWEPGRGLRHNPHKLLLDPYATALEGSVSWGPAVYGHEVTPDTWFGDGLDLSTLDSAGSVPRSVVVDRSFDWQGDAPPLRPRSDTVVYETHVRGFSMTRPGVPVELRGTYAGFGHPDSVAYLADLGVTAVELLPVHAFTHEPALVRRGSTNHWGYNSLGFFAPHAAYAHASTPDGVVAEVKEMVRSLHAAGIEVILDVVYNHTAEQSVLGATLAYRGLDSLAYYRLDERGHDIDVTGCGNTLDLSHPTVTRLVLDSLRYWVQEFHVDGFRFDLAVALARGRGEDYDADHPFHVALRTDPVLSQVKLIAEPWDLGIHGWRTGQFPPPFSEWNDRFRDGVRTFWLRDRRAMARGQAPHGVQDLATRLAGSHDLFGGQDRIPVASVNFVGAHDGFTLHDTTAYDYKHNEANGEYNADGTNANASWNHGREGVTDDAGILLARRRSLRNLLATLLFSTGLPMLRAGDELGHTQGGNNNAYCQDNDTSWLGWDHQPWQEDLAETTRFLIRLRREHLALRQRTWPMAGDSDGVHPPGLAWFAADGGPMTHQWGDPHCHLLQMFLGGHHFGHRSLLLVLYNGLADAQVTLPKVPGVTAYELLWDSSWERPRPPGAKTRPRQVPILAGSMQAYGAVTKPRS